MRHLLPLLMKELQKELQFNNWLERNRRIFEEKEESIDDVIWSKLKFTIAWWIVNQKMFRGLFATDVARSLRVLL